MRSRTALSAPLLLTLLLLAGACDDVAGPPGELPASWMAVDAGDYHTCALDADGRAWCWGSNQFGQLGRDDMELSPWPQPVSGDLRFVDLSAGFSHTCAVTAEGFAYCWGRGRHGELGQDALRDASAPTPVEGGWVFYSISAGHQHTCGITLNRQAVCWGDNGEGQLGTGLAVDGLPESARTPVLVGDGELRFHSISAGHTHTCGATLHGLTHCWGSNRRAQLGTTSFEPSPRPVSVHAQVPLLRVSAGSETTCGITLGGEPQCWGSNEGGKLGTSTIEVAGNPIPVDVPVALNSISVGGGLHVCGVSGLGQAYCWGDGQYGQLGQGQQVESAGPVPVATTRTFLDVTAGLRHSCGLATDGGILCWGDGAAGQLGTGDFAYRTEPTPIAQ